MVDLHLKYEQVISFAVTWEHVIGIYREDNRVALWSLMVGRSI